MFTRLPEYWLVKDHYYGQRITTLPSRKISRELRKPKHPHLLRVALRTARDLRLWWRD